MKEKPGTEQKVVHRDGNVVYYMDVETRVTYAICDACKCRIEDNVYLERADGRAGKVGVCKACSDKLRAAKGEKAA